MTTQGVIDTCVHQWTVDIEEMAELMPNDTWQKHLDVRSKVQEPVSGHLTSTLPWPHAYWNEDSPDYQRPDDAYTNSEQYRSPALMDEQLASQGVDTALLAGHQVMFFPDIDDPNYTAALVSAYNTILKQKWLAESDRLKGHILVTGKKPEASVKEIEKYADDPDMVSVLLYGGGRLSLGHDYYYPIYEAVEEAGLPLTIHTSGNPVYRQTASGRPEHFVEYDTNLAHNHMTNLITMVFQGVYDRFPDLRTVWAGRGSDWILPTLWRSTRYYRNLKHEAVVPYTLDSEPNDYLENIWATTYPLGQMDEQTQQSLFEMIGMENLIYASGYPHWNHDSSDSLPDLSETKREQILKENAKEVYAL